MLKKLSFVLVLFCFALAHISVAQNDSIPKTRILFIFDASQSMFGQFGGRSKIDVAQKLFSEALDSLKSVPNLELALRVYGNRFSINSSAQNCDDTHLEVPFSEDNIDDIKHVIKSVVPKGTTPIARSLELSETDFPPCSDCRNVIVLITDGIEACDGDPCAVARALRKNKVFLKPFVIGVGVVEDYKEHFYCIGNYFDAKDPEQFKSVLSLVLSEALNNTTCQVNLLDVKGEATESNVNMSFYDQFSGELKYNYVHTMNHYGLPDTLSVDPSVNYKITVQTIPAVTVENVKLIPGQHNIIPIETPQGTFRLKQGGRKMETTTVRISEKASCTTLYHGAIDQGVKLLVGSYTAEVFTTPKKTFDFEIAQSEESIVELEAYGLLIPNILSKGYGSVYQKNEKNELLLVRRLDENQPAKNIQLLPGKYVLVYRSLNASRAFHTVEKEFTINSGKTVRISI